MKLKAQLEQNKIPQKKSRTLQEDRRTRDRLIQIRVSEQEHEVLTTKARTLGKTITAFIVDSLIPQVSSSPNMLSVHVQDTVLHITTKEAQHIVVQIIEQLTKSE